MTTKTEYKALTAVREGRVERVYGERGNVLRCPGVGSAVLWRLDRAGLIQDERGSSHGLFSHRAKIVLTAKGEEALKAATA